METGIDGIGVAIQVGMLVVRGPDWRYGRQDGGSVGGGSRTKKQKKQTNQRFGKVVELRQWITKFNGTDGTTSGKPVTVPGSVRVQWLDSKQVNVYRYGAEEKWDVRVVDQLIHDVNWESVMNEMPDDYHLPSQKKALRDSVTTSSDDLVVLEAMYKEMNGARWRANVGWVDRYGPLKKNPQTKQTKQEAQGQDAQQQQQQQPGQQQGASRKEEEEKEEEVLSDPCRDHWSGITCNTKVKPARVFAIDLSNNGLVGSIPKNIGNMTFLKTITLSNNRLTGTLPETLGACVRLEYFSVEINRLEGSLPRSYGNLAALKWLSVYNNQLSGSVPAEILRLSALTHVFIQQNKLTGERPVFLNPDMESYQYHQNQFSFAARKGNIEL